MVVTRSQTSPTAATSATAAAAAGGATAAFDFNVLHGVRASSTLYIVAFHTLYYAAVFMTERVFNAWFYSAPFIGLRNGMCAVDVFFVMTGFLLSHGVWRQGLLPESKQPPMVWKSFVWRRLVRLYPAYVATLFFYLVVLFRGRGMFPITEMPAPGVTQMLLEHDPSMTLYPTSPHLSPANLLFLNNWLPFGGCMGWTWSLAVQGQFYALFPLLVKWFGRGRRLITVIVVGIVVAHLFRWWLHVKVMSEFTPHMYMFEYEYKTSFFMYFNVWYCNTLTRMHCIFTGTVAAYVVVHHADTLAWLRGDSDNDNSNTTSSSSSSSVAPLAVRSVITASALYAIYRNFVPVSTSLFDQWVVNDGDASAILNFSAWQNVVYGVGGVGWLYGVSVLLLFVGARVGVVGRALHRVWSVTSLWRPLARVSYGVYLIHPVVISIVWRWSNGNAPMLVAVPLPHFIGLVALVTAVSFAYGYVMYYAVERPANSYFGKTSPAMEGGGDKAAAAAAAAKKKK